MSCDIRESLEDKPRQIYDQIISKFEQGEEVDISTAVNLFYAFRDLLNILLNKSGKEYRDITEQSLIPFSLLRASIMADVETLSLQELNDIYNVYSKLD